MDYSLRFRRRAAVCLIVLPCLTIPRVRADELSPDADDPVKDALVKIYTTVDPPDYHRPWAMRGQYGITGSGAILSGRRILSNAHVVGDQTFIQVRRFGEARKYTARILNVNHAVDLALLTVDDEDFFAGAATLEIGDLPHIQQDLIVYGFPIGGDTLSVTKGAVNRIEHCYYTQSGHQFLAVQIDAAINPGNSGGPAVVGGRIAGVAMQGIPSADRIGYLIPPPVIRHFLTDLEDGRLDGNPSFGMYPQNMESPAMRRRAGMPPGLTGVQVVRTIHGTSVDGVLKAGDVLLAIDGYPVADDATVEFRPKERTFFTYCTDLKQIGETVTVDILREGKQERVSVTLSTRKDQSHAIPLDQYDVRPRYYIYGGVVFSPLTLDLLKVWGENWAQQAPGGLVNMLEWNYPTRERDEVVLVLQVLPADVNEGYHHYRYWPIETVNGARIRNLRHLIEVVEGCGDAPFLVVRDEQGVELVLDRQEVAAGEAALLATYRIPCDRSTDLVVTKKAADMGTAR